MLAPDEDRALLMDALRPPDGYELDQAVGATYTLDLTAALFAPLAFALFDWAADGQGEPDPLAVLEAARRHADAITIFCQAGSIDVPPRDRTQLLSFLEDGVVEALPRAEGGIFHPKMWVLRFRPSEDPQKNHLPPGRSDGATFPYRVVISSRNLTFHQSWDTVVILDGDRVTEPVSQTGPLADFVAALPDLAREGALPAGRREQVADLAEDLRFVDLEPPEGFDEIRFLPLGLDGNLDVDWQADRSAVVSPFVSADALRSMSSEADRATLVSRPESLDAVGPEAVESFDETLVLTHGVATAEPDDESGLDETLHGLHAKLYLLEQDGRLRLRTGSANATDAAFERNVELLAELGTDQFSVHDLLGQDGDTTTFLTLLTAHTPDLDEHEGRAEAALRADLDRFRRQLGALTYTARLTSEDDGYLVRLTGEGELPAAPASVTEVRCWPASYGGGWGREVQAGSSAFTTEWGSVDEDLLTSFFVFEVTGQYEDVEDEVRFVVNAQLIGAPTGRASRALADLLHNRQEVLRYLLYLLAGLTEGLGAVRDMVEGSGSTGHGSRSDPPLLENLVKALARDPARLDWIANLVEGWQASGRADELLPEHFEEIWEPIQAARQSVSDEGARS